MLVLFFARGAKAYFAWIVFSCPLQKSFLISRHHAKIRRWCYGVAPWVDVSEILWRLTEALVAELSVCVALGWNLYQIYSVQIFHQSRHLAKTKLHPEYPHRKKMNPALKQEISVFCEPEHRKKHATLRKIHNVFTAALSTTRYNNTASYRDTFDTPCSMDFRLRTEPHSQAYSSRATSL